MNEPHKVLLIAFIESSRPAAYEITEQLRHSGYSTDICYARPDPDDPEAPDTNLNADLFLTSTTDVSIYEAVVFLDDGAHAKNSIALAKRADDAGLTVGGYGNGCQVLSEAGLLKEKFIPANLPKDFLKGGKPVNAPAVRCDNVVTSAGKCAPGFAMLLLDALGGEVEKIIESKLVPVVQKASLVVSRLERWPEYWELAERLSKLGNKLLIANWNDIDVEDGILKRCLLLDPGSDPKVIVLAGRREIPQGIWFKQTSIGINETIAAVVALEKIGCVNVNSSEAIKKANDKLVTASLLDPICNQGSPAKYDDASVDAAVDLLLSDGLRWTKPIAASLGRGVIRIQGRGRTAIVSKRIAGSPVHKIMDRMALSKLLRSSYNRDSFMVQDDLGSICVGDKNFEIRFVMRRLAKGWKSSCEIARAGSLISNPNFDSPGIKIYACSAKQALKTAFPDDWQNKLAAAREKAHAACIAFQAGLDNPDGVTELGIDITFAGAEPNVIEINSIPDLTFVDHARRGRFAMTALANGLGLEEQPYEDVPEQQVQDSRADVAPALDAKTHATHSPMLRNLLFKEMAHQGMHLQDDHKVAIREHDGIVVVPIREAIQMVRSEQKHYLDRFRAVADGNDEVQAKRAASVAMRAMFRLRLLKELYFMLTLDRELVKTADYAFNFTGEEYDYGNGSVDGPYANVRTPIRMYKWPEGDEGPEDTGQIDEQTIKNLTRYHPESWQGFYAQFDLLHRNEPEKPLGSTSFDNFDSSYPSAYQYGTPQYGRSNKPS